MALTTPAAAPAQRFDPALRRGLKRVRKFGELAAIEPAPLPEQVQARHFLALMTRSRRGRTRLSCDDPRRLSPRFLYRRDAFTCAWAEYGTIYRLTAGGRYGGTLVTTMVQLVADVLADDMHPAWDMTGDRFAQRDRHHSAVRRRLQWMIEMGLLQSRVDHDSEGWDRRTVLKLNVPPTVTPVELAEAAEQLARWQKKYGLALNSPRSCTQVRNANKHGRPLTSSERQRRGIAHTKAQATAAQQKRFQASDGKYLTVAALPHSGISPIRVRPQATPTKSKTAPPCGAVATPQNNSSPKIQDAEYGRNAGYRTGVTRASANRAVSVNAASQRKSETAGIDERGGELWQAEISVSRAVGASGAARGPGELIWDPAAVVARVTAREAQRAGVVEVIARQATMRAEEVAGWGLGRSWPAWRVREAWVVARWGASAAADMGASAAGPVHPEDWQRLRRALRRYESNAQAAPAGWPVAGLGGLLMLGTEASSRYDGPRTLRYAIGALDQLSKRMRALTTEDSTRRLQKAAERAQKRRQPPARTRLEFRVTKSRWPAWVVCDEHGTPLFDGGVLQVDAQHPACPGVGSSGYELVVRDAYLLADRRPPLTADGRRVMAARHRGERERARRPQRRSEADWGLAELARLSGIAAGQLQRVDKQVRAEMLARLRSEQASRARAHIEALGDRLSRHGEKRAGQ